MLPIEATINLLTIFLSVVTSIQNKAAKVSACVLITEYRRLYEPIQDTYRLTTLTHVNVASTCFA
jgi:hypothetical protein